MAGETITTVAVIDAGPARAGADQYTRAINSMRDATSRTASQLDKMTGATRLLRDGMVTLVAAFAIKSIVGAADSYTVLKTKMETMAGSAEAGAAALSKIKDVARASRTSTSDMADAFAKMTVGLRDSKISQDDAISSLGTLSKAMQLSGASAEQIKAAMDGYADAFIRGRFEGRQFLNLMQDMPLLMQRLQAATGQSSEVLRRWAIDGKFTAGTVKSLLSDMADEIDFKFSQMPRTVGGSLTRVAEAISKTLGKAFSDSSTASSEFVKAMDALRDKISSPEVVSQVSAIADNIGYFVLKLIEARNAIDDFKKRGGLVGWLKREYEVLKELYPGELELLNKEKYTAAAEGLDTLVGSVERLAKAQKAVGDGGWKTTVTVGSPKSPLDTRETDREKDIKRAIDLERMQIDLAKAHALDDKEKISAVETELSIRSKITDEIRKNYPDLAAKYEAQIRITEAAKRESQILAENRALAKEFGQTLSDSIVTAAKSGDTLAQSFRNVLAQMVEMIGKAIILKPLIDSLSEQGGSFLSGIGFNAEQGLLPGLKGLFGFADGGSFQVGGAGGTDSQLVAFRASPDETVTITRPDQQSNRNVTQPVNVHFNVSGDATDETIERMRRMAEQVFAQRTPALVNASVDAVRDRNIRDRNFLRR